MKRALQLVLLAFLVSSCNQQTPPVGGVIPDQVFARVVSLAPSITEIVAGFRGDSVLVGRTASDNRPDYVKSVTIVSNPRPDMEKLIRLQPDLILADENLLNPADLEALKKGNWKFVSFKIRTVADWEDMLWKIGSLLQHQMQVSEMVDEAEQARKTAQTDPPNPKPKVLVAMGGSKPWVAGVDSFQADVVRNAGGEPIGPPGDKFVQSNPEQILLWNPDVVFCSDSPAGYTGAAWSGTTAVKKKRVIQIQPDILLRPGSDVPKLISAMYRELRNAAGQ